MRYGRIGQRREKHQLGAQRAQGVEIGCVDKAEGGVARDGNRLALECRHHGRGGIGGRKVHRPALQILQRHLAQRRGGQRIGRGVQPFHGIRHFGRYGQAQVALGQAHGGIAQHRAQPLVRRDAGLQHAGMARIGHAVGEHPGPRHVGAVVLQAEGQRAEGGHHARRVHHRQHRQAEALRQVRRAGLAVKEAHGTFDDDQVRLLRGRMQARTAISLAGHPQVHLVHRRAAGQGVPARVQKIRPALEHPHAPPLARMQPRQRAGHRRLALAGSRGGDEDGGAAGGFHHAVSVNVKEGPSLRRRTAYAWRWHTCRRSGKPCRSGCPAWRPASSRATVPW
jgi:hypothetical protein